MGKLRKRNRKRALTLDEVAANLPARFLTPKLNVVGGTQQGLADYVRDLEAHIGRVMGKPASQFHAAYVMNRIGVDAAVWTGQALGHTPSREPFETDADRECAGCREWKPGMAFDGPVYPGQPQFNLCRVCERDGVSYQPDLRLI